MNEDISVMYDSDHDLLFITIGEPQRAITDEVAERIHFRYSVESDKLCGIVITSFRKGFLAGLGCDQCEYKNAWKDFTKGLCELSESEEAEFERTH